MAKFQCPEGTTSVSVGGEQFNADENGQIEAPDGVAVLLEPHGFKRALSPAQAKAPQPDQDATTPALIPAPEDQQLKTDGEPAPAQAKAANKKAADKAE